MVDSNLDLAELAEQAWRAFDRAEYHRAEEIYEVCLEQTPTADLQRRRELRYLLAFAYAHTGRFREARAIYTDLLAWQRESGSQTAPGGEWSAAVMLHQLAMVERLAGDTGAGFRYLEEERSLREADDNAGLSANSYEFGELYLMRGDPGRAEEEMRRSLDESHKSGDMVCEACSLRGLGDVLAAQGRSAEARSCYRNSIGHFFEAGDMIGADDVRAKVGRLAGKP